MNHIRLSFSRWVSGLPQTGQMTASLTNLSRSWQNESRSYLPKKIALSPTSEAAVASSLARYIRTLPDSRLSSFGNSA